MARRTTPPKSSTGRAFTGSKRVSLLVGAILAGGLASLAFGIGMRHDVPAQRYVDLANNREEFEAGRYPDFSCVCAVGQEGRFRRLSVIGSGVLVAPEWVLTAAHVVISPDQERGDFEPELRIRFGSDIHEGYLERGVEGIALPIALPRLRPLLTRATRRGEAAVVHAEFHDLALLKLDAPVEGIAPVRWETEEVPLLGQMICIAGYGDGAQGNNPRERAWDPPSLRRAAMNVVDRDIRANPISGDPRGGIFLFDFDNGEAERNSLDGQCRAWRAIFGTGRSSAIPTALEGSSYPGDSGGPAFARFEDGWRLVGLSGYGTGFPPGGRRTTIEYGDIVVYTRIADHSAWIAATVAERLEEPIEEAPAPIVEVEPVDAAEDPAEVTASEEEPGLMEKLPALPLAPVFRRETG